MKSPLVRFALCWLFFFGAVACQSVRSKRIDAYENLSRLEQDGLILVRLKQLAGKVEALEALGDPVQADRVEEKAEGRQARLLNMFRDHFRFCPVYFFYADDSGKVRDGRWGEVSFLDVDGNPVNGDSLYGRPYYVAEFSRVYDTKVTGNNPEGEERMAAGMAGKDGLVLKDSNFIQLNDPYPYKFFHWKPENAVLALDRSLREYLSKQESKRYMMEYLLEKKEGSD